MLGPVPVPQAQPELLVLGVRPRQLDEPAERLRQGPLLRDVPLADVRREHHELLLEEGDPVLDGVVDAGDGLDVLLELPPGDPERPLPLLPEPVDQLLHDAPDDADDPRPVEGLGELVDLVLPPRLLLRYEAEVVVVAAGVVVPVLFLLIGAVLAVIRVRVNVLLVLALVPDREVLVDVLDDLVFLPSDEYPDLLPLARLVNRNEQ